ncbi:MAG TPA: bifunctional UDP-N-acetylmuramoyl-tripeptide:D-alanyl-D-alanine ligase/alanine racemase [Bacteroidales bacterium]|nr:bifunctional UDP-N-acetylmuramoyl-tripeptide:D-alanyl-D-alanine ligase/alanine racemase [Bacteroidales bacterium]
MNYTCTEIASVLNCEVLGKNNGVVKYVITDSRYPVFTDESMFVALSGNRFDGHQFVDDIYKQGCKVFLLEHKPAFLQEDATYFIVPSTLNALQKIASWHRSHFKYQVIGITGSYGKSILKEWLFDLLCNQYNVVRSPKSYNSQLGVPLSIFQMSEKNSLGIFEAGISKPNEMYRLSEIIKPTIGVFTNIGNAHQENFTSIDEKIDEKIQLFQTAELIIYPSKYENISERLKKNYPNKKLVAWGERNDDFLRIQSIDTRSTQTSVSFFIENSSYTIHLPFTHFAFIENAITSLVVAYILGIPMQQIIEQISLLRPIDMRLKLVEAAHHCTLINDFYNSDLTSISVALEFLKQQNNHPQKAVVLSDVPHTGFKTDEVYKTLAKWINQEGINLMVCIGKEIATYKNLFKTKALFFDTVEAFLEQYNRVPFANMTVLLKGARAFAFERISEKMQLQTHETILKIDLNALLNNYFTYKSLLPSNVKIVAMVKAFSYGSGLFEVARLLQHHHVDYLAVAYADEGIELRQNGIHVPIMVMNPEAHTFDAIIEHRLEPVIYNFRILELFAKAVSHIGYTDYPFHVKVDTGMHRLGFLQDEITQLAIRIKQLPWIKIKSVFSHLAAAEDKNEDVFTMRQINLLQESASKLQQVCDDKILVHILNSAGIERFPDFAFDMVRLGIGLYGISNAGVIKDKLLPVFSLRTIVSQIKELEENETIGYNRRGVLHKKSRIAVLPVGYADGIDRRLGNGVLHVKIKNKKAPVIGTICMDMCMVDVTDIDVNEGDEVVVFESIEDVESISKILGTIPYELFTGISRRVKRVYYHD